jgi:HK97 family phage prohead protease/HK97 family phage major capsid protein
MLTKDKILNLSVPFVTKQAEGEESEDLIIKGHASTNDEDRHGDIVASDAWLKDSALSNFKKNPVILAFHDHSRPIGKAIEHEATENGLQITAKISKAAGDIIGLIKDGILSAFSIGFVIKDAKFDPSSGVFLIKELELLEVSVVSVPANQNTLFNIGKNFSDEREYEEFKKQFIQQKSEETLMDEKTKEKAGAETPAFDAAALAAQISKMVKDDIKAEAETAKKAKEDAEKEIARIEATATTAAERLIKDVKDELVGQEGTITQALASVKEALEAGMETKELHEAYSKDQPNKMRYAEEGSSRFDSLTTDEKDGMFYAAVLGGKSIADTKYFKEFVTKSGMEHWDPGVAGQWEDEYSTRVQDAMRQQLVVEPIFQTIPMRTPTMNMPINPDAGDATWISDGALRSINAPWDETGDGQDTSTGTAVDHLLDEQTLIARKLATREYVGYEEEEDSIVALAPIIRDAVSRRMALTADLAFLRGTGNLTSAPAYDPILGLEGRGANTTDVTVAGSAGWGANFTEDAIVDMRRNLSIYGLDPSSLVLLTSHDLYYEMMKLNVFKTLEVYGPQHTVRSGEVGSIFGIPVLVSQQFDNAAITAGTVGTTLATLVRPGNFVKGELRGLMTEADKDIVNQKRVIVSSRRFAFQDIITGEATVNLQIAS